MSNNTEHWEMCQGVHYVHTSGSLMFLCPKLRLKYMVNCAASSINSLDIPRHAQSFLCPLKVSRKGTETSLCCHSWCVSPQSRYIITEVAMLTWGFRPVLIRSVSYLFYLWHWSLELIWFKLTGISKSMQAETGPKHLRHMDYFSLSVTVMRCPSAFFCSTPWTGLVNKDKLTTVTLYFGLHQLLRIIVCLSEFLYSAALCRARYSSITFVMPHLLFLLLTVQNCPLGVQTFIWYGIMHSNTATITVLSNSYPRDKLWYLFSFFTNFKLKCPNIC